MPTTPTGPWPRVEATLNPDGTSQVVIGGTSHTLSAPSIADARNQVISLVAHHAAQLGRPLYALTRDPTGTWPIIISPNGDVAPDPERRPSAETSAGDSSAHEAGRSSPEGPGPVGGLSPEAPAPADRDARTAPDETAWTDQPVSQDPGPADMPAEARAWQAADEDTPAPLPNHGETRERRSFLKATEIEQPATQGWRGRASRLGVRMSPSPAERSERSDVHAVSQHWPGPRTIAVVNGKGGAGKTPATVLLSAVFARHGGAGVIAWDANQTRGTLGWRTDQGPHEATVLDLLPQAERLLGTGAQSADLAHYVHHQTGDRYDVLRSQPLQLAADQRVTPRDVDLIWSVVGKYYRLVVIDTGNDESDPVWLQVMEHADQIVVPTTTRADHAEAGALLLDALRGRDDRSRRLAENAVAVVTQADPRASRSDINAVINGYSDLAREVVTIPHDPAIVDGVLRWDSLRPTTQRAWLHAAAAVAGGL
ncbi:ATPase [Actinomyces sp. 2119]|uniref:MinD/ParA family ATP-binding protein n=1 Tax=Actinomyces sp. 2119 TaxID=2321393 RepID=UPI000E6CE566|nr:AAA family ATPase [Actinomyces sp. 2119]RJF44914.1 ATPase [Actinomyces sp. 2119]